MATGNGKPAPHPEQSARSSLQKLAEGAGGKHGLQQHEEVSQDGVDYVLDAMNGADNMKQETQDYKPAKKSNFRFSLWGK